MAGLVATTTAQRSDLKHALPADTIAFFSLPDLDSSVQQLLDMPLLRMWGQKELQEFLAPALAELNKQWQQGLQQAEALQEQGGLPFAPQDLLQLRLYGMTAALTHLTLPTAADPEPDLGVLLHCDFGPSAPLWKKVIEFALQQLEAEIGAELVKSESEAAGVKVMTWQPAGPAAAGEATPRKGLGLNLAWVGDGILVGTTTDLVRTTLDALASKSKVLTESPKYKAVGANIDVAGAEIELFCNVQRGYETLFDVLEFVAANVPDFPPEISVAGLDRALDALGMKAIKAAGASSIYQKNKAISKSYVLCPAPERKGFVADGTKDLDLSVLKWVPRKATSCSAGTMNLTAVWDSLIGAVKAYDPDVAEQGLAQLAEVEKQLGFTIRDDLFGAFGDQVLQWSMPMQGIPGMGGGTLINALFLVHMKDQDRLLKCLKGLSQLAKGHFEFDSNTRDDITTYYIKLNVDLSDVLPVSVPLDMVQPVFGFQGDYMVLGFSRADVRKTIKAMAAEKPESETIRANKEFAAMLSEVATERLTAVSFSDNRASFDNIYGLAYGLTPFVPEDFPLDMQKLPDEGAFLSQHLFPSVSHSHTDGNGFATMNVGPFGPELGILILGLALTAGAGFAITQQRGMMRGR